MIFSSFGPCGGFAIRLWPSAPRNGDFFLASGQHRAAAQGARISQAQLADVLGVSQSAMAAYECGRRRVSVSMLPLLARALAPWA